MQECEEVAGTEVSRVAHVHKEGNTFGKDTKSTTEILILSSPRASLNRYVIYLISEISFNESQKVSSARKAANDQLCWKGYKGMLEFNFSVWNTQAQVVQFFSRQMKHHPSFLFLLTGHLLTQQLWFLGKYLLFLNIYWRMVSANKCWPYLSTDHFYQSLFIIHNLSSKSHGHCLHSLTGHLRA